MNILGYEAIADVLAWLYTLGNRDEQHQRCIRLLAQQFEVEPEQLLDELSDERAIALQSLAPGQLEQLGRVQLTFETIADLQQWIQEQLDCPPHNYST